MTEQATTNDSSIDSAASALSAGLELLASAGTRELVAALANRLEDDDVFLRAMKWRKDGEHWIPPYNQNIMFKRSDALNVIVDAWFLSDMAEGRW